MAEISTCRHPGKAVFFVTDIWHAPERDDLRKTVRAFAEREILRRTGLGRLGRSGFGRHRRAELLLDPLPDLLLDHPRVDELSEDVEDDDRGHHGADDGTDDGEDQAGDRRPLPPLQEERDDREDERDRQEDPPPGYRPGAGTKRT